MAKFTHYCLVISDSPFAFFWSLNQPRNFTVWMNNKKTNKKPFSSSRSVTDISNTRLTDNELKAQNNSWQKSQLQSFCFTGTGRHYLLTTHFPLTKNSKTFIHDLVLCHFRAFRGAYNSKMRTISEEKICSKWISLEQ